LWDVQTGDRIATLCCDRGYYNGNRGKVNSVAFSLDGELLASSSDNGSVMLWDAKSGERRTTLKGHSKMAFAIAFSSDSRWLASTSWDKTVKLWAVRSGNHRTLKGHTNSVLDVSFSPNCQLVASSSHDYTARVWDATTGDLLTILSGHSHYVLQGRVLTKFHSSRIGI
jgi:WD40 repeat protein